VAVVSSLDGFLYVLVPFDGNCRRDGHADQDLQHRLTSFLWELLPPFPLDFGSPLLLITVGSIEDILVIVTTDDAYFV
jgi:hypothetical protein